MLTRKAVSLGLAPLVAVALGACASAPPAQPRAAAVRGAVRSCDTSQRLVVDNRTGYGVEVSVYEGPGTAMGSGAPRHVLAVVQSGAQDTVFIPGQRPELVYREQRDRMPNGGEWPIAGLRAWCVAGA